MEDQNVKKRTLQRNLLIFSFIGVLVKRTLQRNLLIFSFIGVLVIGLLGGIVFSIVEYRGITSDLSWSQELSDTEDYLGASESLDRAQGRWLVNLFDVRKPSIEDLFNEIGTRIKDQKFYQAGLDIGNEGDWGIGMTLLSEIQSNSFYYQRAQTTIEQFRGKVLAQELETERTNRRFVEDEVKRQILTFNLVRNALESETTARLTAESATQTERLAKEEVQREVIVQTERADLEKGKKFLAQIEATSQRERADLEEAAKVQAKTDALAQTERADSEEEAKIQAQIDALAQQQRADLEESAKIQAQIDALAQQERANLEEAAKVQAEADALAQTERADSEEDAKIQAQIDVLAQQQRADLEESAKIQAQIDALAQQQRADLEEKARIQELAVTNPMIQGIVAGELKFYFEPLPIYAGIDVSSAVENISSSLLSWSPYGTTTRRVSNANDADLYISWVKDYGSHTIGQSIFKSHIKVGLGRENCRGDWQAFDASTVEKVLWHEIGHSMGYGHSSDPNNVMYWQVETRFDVEQYIADIVSPGWYFTYELCRGGNHWYSFESDDSDTGFDLYVLPPGTDASEISMGGGLVYTGCGEANTVAYTGTCNVPAGALIYIENYSLSDAVRLDGVIVLLNEPPRPVMDWDQTAFEYDDAQLNTYWNLFH
jgi:hypothetical protein